MTLIRAFGMVKGVAVELDLAPIGRGLFLRFDVAPHFLAMQAAAKVAGVELIPSGPRSAFRTAEQQAELIVEEGNAKETPGGLAAPVGSSPHQAGIAIDLETAGGTNPAFHWLSEYASGFGFRRAHTTLGNKEPWHWEWHGVEGDHAA